MKILFIRSSKASLPEIDAYINYFNQFSEFQAFDSSLFDGNQLNYAEYDVVWEFKGFGGYRKQENQILVHEYASLSTGKFPKLKNYLKRILNPKPDLRVFLNNSVKDALFPQLHDNFVLRDMGVADLFFDVKPTPKEYDYVYVGEINQAREMDIFLRKFVAGNNGQLLLVGKVDPELEAEFKKYSNIHFVGKVPYVEVPKWLSKAHYGINYIPVKYPFDIQTSTKLLEYLAVGLKVISTDYKWVREFEKENNCNFYFINENDEIYDFDDLENHDFNASIIPDKFRWDSVIEKSGIKEELLNFKK